MERKHFKGLLVSVMLAALLLVTAACGSAGGAGGSEGTTEAKASKGKLRVAIELAYPPFDYKDEAGEPTGVDVDLIKDFGEA